MSVLTTDPKAGQGDASGNSGNPAPTDWRVGLPEDLRKEAVFESIKGKDWAEAGPLLAKNYVHAQRLVGADKLVLPTKDSTPEQIADFRKKLGVPDKADDYAVTLPEGVTEDKLDKDMIKSWRERLHKQGVPKGAAEGLIKDYLTDSLSHIQAAEKATADREKAWDLELKQELGVNYDKNINFARHALAEFADPKLTEWLEASGAGNHPAVIKFFAKVGSALSDDKSRAGNSVVVGVPRTAAAAEAMLNSKNSDDEWTKALYDANHPRHAAVITERTALFKAAYPSGASE